MNTSLENKLIDNYWISKLKLCPIVNDSSLALFETEEIIIKKEVLSYFNKLSANNEVVEFTVLLSIYNILLERYFETVHFIASSGLAKNEHTLLYKFNSIEGTTFKECLNKVKEEVQEVFKYSNFNQSLMGKTSFCDFSSFGFSYNSDFHNEKSDFPFYLKINKKEEGLTVSIFYDKNFITEYVANHFLGNIKRWLINLESYINQEVKNLRIISKQEREEVLYSFNNTEVNYPKGKTIVDLFEEQVEKTPDHVAVVFEDEQLTYKKLNEQANQLAQYLSETYTIQPDDLIGIKLERSEQLLVAILGVLKSGGAYVPIDINYPEERINYIEKDSNCKIVIDHEELENFRAVKDNYSVENLKSSTKSNHLAYVIYTSGTTGKPKGVMIMHQNTVAMLNWANYEYRSSNFEVVFAGTSYCFDISIFEIFFPLSVGKSIRLLQNSLEALKYLDTDTDILLNMVPSNIRNLMEQGCHFQNVTVINLAGEVFPVEIAKKLIKTKAEIRNLYGPSEDTTYSTCYKLKEHAYETVPVGSPISNTQAYVLDADMQLAPIGVRGKLYLSGAGLSQGYLNRDDFTKQKFIENPFLKGERIYDTGDLVSWQPDGNLNFFGRIDNQVKIRGYRIELEEIENVINSFSEDFIQVHVSMKTLDDFDVLVAYYVEKKQISPLQLKEFLIDKLPFYMVPGYFIKLKNIPLTPNGKIDKKALPEVSSKNVISREFIGTSNETEERLVSIWKEILDVDTISVIDNFFELGGHSLKITRLMNEIYKSFYVNIPSSALFHNSILKDQSILIQNELKTREWLVTNKSKNISNAKTEKFKL